MGVSKTVSLLEIEKMGGKVERRPGTNYELRSFNQNVHFINGLLHVVRDVLEQVVHLVSFSWFLVVKNKKKVRLCVVCKNGRALRDDDVTSKLV